MDDRDAHARLAELVEARRLQLRLSVSAAARAAGIDRATWGNIENRNRRLREYNYAGVERALQWAPGSIDRVLNDEDPEETAPSRSSPSDERDEEIDLVMTDTRLTNELKVRIIDLIYKRREQDRQAAMEETRRLIEAFRDRGEEAG